MVQRTFLFAVPLAVLAVLMIAVNTADAIECYHCNSGKNYEGSACADLKDDTFLKDCDELAREELVNYGINRTYVMCRIFYQDVEGDNRVVRSCATGGQPQRGCIDRTGTKGIKLRYCECTDGKCNDSSALTAAIMVTSLAAVLAFALGRH